MGQLASHAKSKETSRATSEETREGFLQRFRAEMRRHKARSAQEVVVRGMWLQSLADFEAVRERVGVAAEGCCFVWRGGACGGGRGGSDLQVAAVGACECGWARAACLLAF